MTTERTVFVVDSDPASCEVTRAVAQALSLRTAQYPTAEGFFQAYSGQPGCLIADLRMPGLSGPELQQQLVAAGLTLPVVLLSAHADVRATVRAMHNGAVTLLEKPPCEQELTQAIEQALELDQQRRQRQQRRAELDRRVGTLTEGEHRVLRLLMEGHTNKVIATRLDLGLRTVEKYRHNLFKKLGVHSLPELVRLIIEWEELSAPTTEPSEQAAS